MEQKKLDLDFFRLDNVGDTMNARIMHKSVDTIEKFDVHPIMTEGKRRRIKCLGEGCPLCANGADKVSRIFVHLYDYGTQKHLVWDRTDKILGKLKEIESDWGGLNAVPVRITRDSGDFPKYSVDALPPQKFPMVDEAVDEKVSWRCGVYRSKEEMEEFIKTGVMPKHKKQEDNYTPKKQTEYFTPKTASSIDSNSYAQSGYTVSAENEFAAERQFETVENEDLPF